MNASQNPIQILGYQISLNKSPLHRVLPPLKTGEVRSAGQVLPRRAHTHLMQEKPGRARLAAETEEEVKGGIIGQIDENRLLFVDVSEWDRTASK